MSRQDEFEQVAMPYARSLLRVARRLTADSVAAEDLVQEALLRAWKNFHQFRAGSNARAWLFKILFNTLYAQARKPEHKAVLLPLSDLDSEPAAGQDPSAGAAMVRRALDELPVDQRAVLLLSVVEGFTCREMAEILNTPIGTVMSRLSRARQAMRVRLGGAPSAECAARESS